MLFPEIFEQFDQGSPLILHDTVLSPVTVTSRTQLQHYVLLLFISSLLLHENNPASEK